jgi:hypothetical protein
MFKKFLTDSGACSGYISSSIEPASVSRVTHFEAIVLTSAESNGSIFAAGVGEGLALAFPTSFAGDGEGVGCCPKLTAVKNIPMLKTMTDLRNIAIDFQLTEIGCKV